MIADKKLLEHVSKISRLNLTHAEIKEFLPQLNEILDAFTLIQKVNTDNVTPSYHPIEIKNVMRDDITGECLSNEDALKNTRHKKDGYFKGPKVV